MWYNGMGCNCLGKLFLDEERFDRKVKRRKGVMVYKESAL